MVEKHDFRIFVIDDNSSIHFDFIKILKIENTFKLAALSQKLFDLGDDNVNIRAFIVMAKHLDLVVLAEDVETTDQIEFLKRYRCEEVEHIFTVRRSLKLSLKDFFNKVEATDSKYSVHN